jgi:hypothetical protein
MHRGWSRPVTGAAATLLLVSCGPSTTQGTALRSYMSAVEPIRLGVNQLLNGADPILRAYQDHRISGAQAAGQLGGLERHFASYALDVNALQPSDPTLSSLNTAYAHTYVLEDSYLNALVSALPDGQFDSLPNTQSEQRAVIVDWRIRLEVIARATGTPLPADLEQAGRGEIAPSVSGS